MNELIVRFYVNEINSDYLKEIISKLNFKDKSSFELEIHKNDEYNKSKSKDFPDGFLYFANFLEYYKEEEQYLEDDISNSKLILEALWSNNIPAIASCDFEDELPEKGGYKSTNIPWNRQDIKVSDTIKLDKEPYKIYKGKNYTEKEWKIFEEQQYQEYLRKKGKS